jgi:diguanylate cyclase (GGDEF)-like protein
MKILLAEDSRAMMLANTVIITDAGHEVIQAQDGKEALSLYYSEKPDLALLDVEMPKLNGFELARKIRSKDEDTWIPIIFLTSHKDDELLSEGIDAGGDDYLTKPISSVVLNAKLKAMQRISEMKNKLLDLTIELSALNKHLQNSVITDPLTGANNRLYLDECIKREWQLGLKNKTELSILIIDVDNFKELNDSNGHQAGDSCLIDLVKLFRTYLTHSSDVLCRYGGDEFVVVLPNTSEKDALLIAKTIRKKVERYSQKHAKTFNFPINISVSIGSASYVPDDTLTYDDFLCHADKALYAAKEGGRNCVIKADIKKTTIAA